MSQYKAHYHILEFDLLNEAEHPRQIAKEAIAAFRTMFHTAAFLLRYRVTKSYQRGSSWRVEYWSNDRGIEDIQSLMKDCQHPAMVTLYPHLLGLELLVMTSAVKLRKSHT